MTNMAQVDRILSEVNELEEKDKILFYHKIGEIFDNFDGQQDEDIPIRVCFWVMEKQEYNKRNFMGESIDEKLNYLI